MKCFIPFRFRYAFTVLSNMIVYGIAWVIFDVNRSSDGGETTQLGASDSKKFRVSITGISKGIGSKMKSEDRTVIPASFLYKSIEGCYRPVRVADGPITALYRFIKNAYSDPCYMCCSMGKHVCKYDDSQGPYQPAQTCSLNQPAHACILIRVFTLHKQNHWML